MKKVCFALFALWLLGAGLASAQSDDVVAAVAQKYGIHGKPIAVDVADRMVQNLDRRVYLPAREIRSLTCHFTPRFTQLDPSKNETLSAKTADGLNYITFSGDLFYLLQEKPLLAARKAVLYWKPIEEGSIEPRFPAVVRLFDEQGQEITVHPFVHHILGYAAMKMQALDLARPFPLPDPAQGAWRVLWFFDDSNADDRALYCLFRPDGAPEFRQLTEIRFDKNNSPVSAMLKQWDPAQNRWQPTASSYSFVALEGPDKVALARAGVAPKVIEYSWSKSGPNWAVRRARGSRTNLESSQPGAQVPYDYGFTDLQLNADVPDAVLAWPVGKRVRLDFSAPEAAVRTIFECLKKDRRDMLPLCTTKPPEAPVLERAPVTYYGYLLATVPSIAARMRITEKLQDGNTWLFHIQVPKLWMREDLESTYKIVSAGGQWKMDGDFTDLERALYE